MAVLVGSARSDEKNGAIGGQAGDQKGGKEVSTQNWYLHSKGWRVLRCINPGMALDIGWCMKEICANDHIGYDQGQRLTLYNEAAKFDFDVSMVTKNVECDCSAAVRVCLAYAGISVANFTTPNEVSRIMASGLFVELTDDKYTKKPDYLRIGDILVTKTQGHTVVVLTDGARSEDNVPPAGRQLQLGDRLLKHGCAGVDVTELQEALIELGYDCGIYGADGDFGDATELSVRSFQRDAGIADDGEFGKISFEALRYMQEHPDTKTNVIVQIYGGNCYGRSEPNTNGEKLRVCKRGETYMYAGKTSDNGWLLIEAYQPEDHKIVNVWVSGKYARFLRGDAYECS